MGAFKNTRRAAALAAAVLLATVVFAFSPQGAGVFSQSPNSYVATVFGCLFGDCSFDPLNYSPDCFISVSPSTIDVGQQSTISWTSDIFSPYLTPQQARVAASGSTTTAPSTTTTYALWDNAGAYSGTRAFYYSLFGIPTPVLYCAVKVTVNQAPPPPTCLLNVAPASILSGDSAQLSYTLSPGVTSASIAPTVGAVSVDPPLNYEVSPTVTTTYTLSVESPNGPNFCQRVVEVTSPQTPTLFLFATPSRVVKGGSTALTWNSTNASACTLRGPGGAMVGTGTQNPEPPPQRTVVQTSVFTLTCTGDDGNTYQKSVTVGIQPSYQEI